MNRFNKEHSYQSLFLYVIQSFFYSSDGVVNQIWFGVTDFNKDGIWTWDDGTIASDNIFGNLSTI